MEHLGTDQNMYRYISGLTFPEFDLKIPPEEDKKILLAIKEKAASVTFNSSWFTNV